MEEILAELKLHGLEPGDVKIDGRLHRFKVHSEDSKNSGWYVFNRHYSKNTGQQFVTGTYGNYLDEEFSWKLKQTEKDLSESEREHIKKQAAAARKIAEQERSALQEEVRLEVAALWEKFGHASEHSYLSHKSIAALRDEGLRRDREALCIPMRDIEGVIWSYQSVYRGQDGNFQKRFYSGGRTKKLFHMVGEFTDSSPTLYFAEGYATAASVHLATGRPVVCAFSAKNLPLVARDFRAKYKDLEIIIAGDDDCWKDESKNPGRTAAELAAKESLGRAVYPKFPAQIVSASQTAGRGPTDWNDLHSIEGLAAVTSQLNSNPPPAPVTLDREAIISAPFPDENSKGVKRGTLANMKELLRRLNITVRYNMITKTDEIIIPNHSFSLDNEANATLAHIMDWCERVQIPYSNLQSYLTAIADQNLYNPVATWIESKPWDGVERFHKFCDTIKARGEEDINVIIQKHAVIQRWMISAVAAAFEPDGVSAHGILVLVGDQNIGKTKWFKSLTPQALGFSADGVTLKVNDKDSVLQTITRWLVELGELDGTLNRSDAAQLKAFITKKNDSLRRAYGRRESKYARRTVFFGSVNENKFLKDPTGNRRFWTIDCESIEHSHDFDMQQVWAEVLTFYRAGESWYLTAQELDRLNVNNEVFKVVDPIEEKIVGHLAQYSGSEKMAWLSATEVCEMIGIREPGQGAAQSAGRFLKKVCGDGAGGRGFRVQRGYSQYYIPINPIHSTAHTEIC